MKCNDNCIEINALPKCLTDDGQLILTNLTFPDSPSQDILAMLHNVSSNASISFTITTDADGNIIESDGIESVGLDLTEAYDLMNHVYKIEFLDKLTMQPVTVSICGEEACCLTFGVLPLTSSGAVPATTGKCGEPCDVVPPTPPPPGPCQFTQTSWFAGNLVSINGDYIIDTPLIYTTQGLVAIQNYFAPLPVTVEFNGDFIITIHGLETPATFEWFGIYTGQLFQTTEPCYT